MMLCASSARGTKTSNATSKLECIDVVKDPPADKPNGKRNPKPTLWQGRRWGFNRVSSSGVEHKQPHPMV